jgi:hypothetical protein
METQTNSTSTTQEVDTQYLVSVNKFVLLSVLTFGLYEIWWQYKVWRFFQQKLQWDIMPAMRALFGIFFLIPLFNIIQSSANEKGYNSTYNSVLLYIGFLLSSLIAQLDNIFLFISCISVVFLIPAVKAFNSILLASREEFQVVEQKNFNGRQIGLIIFGILWWFLLIVSFAE